MPYIARDNPGPFEVCLLAFIFVSRLLSVTGHYDSVGTNAIIGEGYVTVWSYLLLAGPVIAYVGIFWQGRESTAHIIEQVGLIPIAGAASIFTVALVARHGWTIDNTIVASAYVTAYGVACYWRIWQIYRYQRYVIARSESFRGVG